MTIFSEKAHIVCQTSRDQILFALRINPFFKSKSRAKSSAAKSHLIFYWGGVSNCTATIFALENVGTRNASGTSTKYAFAMG